MRYRSDPMTPTEMLEAGNEAHYQQERQWEQDRVSGILAASEGPKKPVHPRSEGQTPSGPKRGLGSKISVPSPTNWDDNGDSER